MKERLVAVALATGTGTGLVVLLAGLALVPVETREQFVPLATLAGSAATLLAAVVAGLAGEALVRPLRRMAQDIESGQTDRNRLRQFASEAPEDVAPLLRSLLLTQSRLADAVDQLERDRAQMHTMFEHMADGVLILDSDEVVLRSNLAAQRLLQRPRLAGHRLPEIVRDPDLVEVVRSAQVGAFVAQVVELLGLAPEARMWVRVIATQLPDQHRTLVLLQDVTDLRAAEVARRDFVANISHELRTPVAALKALVETLESGALDDPEVGPDFLRRMHVEVDGLAQLVSELLELARVESGRLELDLAPVPAADLVAEAVERTQPYAARVGLQVGIVETGNNLVVSADARRIGQVLGNLLANAVKFTPPGGRIEVGAREAGAWVELWVADTGVGIDPADLSRVFERFYKTDPSRTMGGTGLGLAICKHLVKAHGGRIWAESAGPGRGATFRFTLQRAVLPAQTEPVPAPASPAA